MQALALSPVGKRNGIRTRADRRNCWEDKSDEKSIFQRSRHKAALTDRTFVESRPRTPKGFNKNQDNSVS
jgi:hypothetical protein